MGELRESKKRETRERISDVATALFFERGFDAVTVDEIAAAARVSKVTVFNYFAKKEDLHIDREEEVKQILRQAVTGRPEGQSAVDALHRLAHRLSEEKQHLACVNQGTVRWWSVVKASPSLQARARELGDEVALSLAVDLGGPEPDAPTRLVASMVILAWRAAFTEAIRVFERGGSAKKVRAAFLALIDQGFAGIGAMSAHSTE